MNKEDWKKMKPGQLLQWNNYDSISPQPNLLFLGCTKGSVWVFSLSDGQRRGGGELEKYGYDMDVSKKPGKRVKLITFNRSDDYTFIIYRFDGEWRCSAGCRLIAADTLQELQTRCINYWDDTHSVDLEYVAGDIKLFLKAHPDSTEAERIKLNRETRKKIKQAIGKLS